jgi:thioredoxin 1
MKKLIIIITVICLFFILMSFIPACADDPDMSPLAKIPLKESLANGKPTIAEFGWRKCIPCKEMRPILERLAEDYKNTVNVLIVEIPNHEDLAQEYGIEVMPVQIFFDRQGKEVNRHAGFLSTDAIITQFDKMGIIK